MSKLLEWERYENPTTTTTIKFESDGRLLVVFQSTKKRSFKYVEQMKPQLLDALLEPSWRQLAFKVGNNELSGLTVLFFMTRDHPDRPIKKLQILDQKIVDVLTDNSFYFKPYRRPGGKRKNHDNFLGLCRTTTNRVHIVKNKLNDLQAFERIYTSKPMNWLSQLPNELKFRILDKLTNEPLNPLRWAFKGRRTFVSNNLLVLPFRALSSQWNEIVDTWIQRTKRSIKHPEFLHVNVEKDDRFVLKLNQSNVRIPVDSLFLRHCFAVSTVGWLKIHLDEEQEVMCQLERIQRCLEGKRQPQRISVFITVDGELKIQPEVKNVVKSWKRLWDFQSLYVVMKNSAGDRESVYSF